MARPPDPDGQDLADGHHAGRSPGLRHLAGKLGRWLKSQGHALLLVAADLQRPNAVNQLSIVAGQAGVDVSRPAGQGRRPGGGRGVHRAARRTMHDVVVVDTAGRLGIDAELMAQAAAIRDAVQPDETLFVVDAMIGQDASPPRRLPGGRRVLRRRPHQARRRRPRWCRAVGPARHRPADHVRLHRREAGRLRRLPPRADGLRILGMGDVLTLIEQAEQHFDADQAEKMAGKLASREGFTLEDFLEQMMAIRKMGPSPTCWACCRVGR